MLRALQPEPSEQAVSTTSLVSTRSGLARAHPYCPTGDAPAGTSYEIVPSVAAQAPVALIPHNRVDATPITSIVNGKTTFVHSDLIYVIALGGVGQKHCSVLSQVIKRAYVCMHHVLVARGDMCA